MVQLQSAPAGANPSLESDQSPISFSIIIETENLASADLPGLFRSLDALEAQTPFRRFRPMRC